MGRVLGKIELNFWKVISQRRQHILCVLTIINDIEFLYNVTVYLNIVAYLAYFRAVMKTTQNEEIWLHKIGNKM